MLAYMKKDNNIGAFVVIYFLPVLSFFEKG